MATAIVTPHKKTKKIKRHELEHIIGACRGVALHNVCGQFAERPGLMSCGQKYLNGLERA